MKNIFVLSVLVLVACGDPGGGGGDGGQTNDGGNNNGGQDGGNNTGNDGGNNNCTPIACSATAGCGTYDDGCGDTINCTAQCECTEGNFETACESKPCQAVTGCSESGTCEYSPVVCGAQTCAPADATHCSGGGCEGLCTGASCTSGLYPCGVGVCATVTQYCDPTETVVDGKVVYANTCVGAPQTGCGTCNLGVRACDSGNDKFTCNEPPNPVTAGGGTVECDSSLAGSTYIYLDTQYTGGDNNGSKARPFTTYTAALADAQSRNARGIVIAGSPTFQEPLTVSNGISVYGGFDGAPGFNPNRAQRPRWDISVSSYDSATNQLVGGRAIDITNGTVLYHLEIRTAAITNQRDANGLGASNVALLARNAPQLALDDVILRAGHAATGADGQDGAPSGNPQIGGNGVGRNPGASGSACSASCTAQAAFVPSGQGDTRCGYAGGLDSNPGNWYSQLKPGNPGTPNNTVKGGTAGTSYLQTNSGCDNDFTRTTAGGPGDLGGNGPPGSDGVKGSVAQVSAQGTYLPNPGSNGTSGQMGTWGGGGGGGGTYADGCNYPNAASDPHVGGAGGGGGGPGCGGDFGRRGLGGGASIALVAAGSTGLAVRNSVLSAGDAGAGGRGGTGASGGAGGIGADGVCPSGPGKCGGKGGNGGAGGRGGHAGGGSGGHSVGIWCVGTTALPTEANTVTVGAAGTGGNAAVPALRGDSGAAVPAQGCP